MWMGAILIFILFTRIKNVMGVMKYMALILWKTRLDNRQL